MHTTLGQIRDLLTSTTEGMAADDWTRHPEGKWSAALILEHLTLTYTGTSYALRKCLQSGQPSATSPTLKQRLAVFWVVGRGKFPKGIEAPRHVQPKGEASEQPLAAALEQLAVMGELIDEAEARFGPKMKIINHPILGPMSAPEWRKFHWLHAQHHAPQIARLRAK